MIIFVNDMEKTAITDRELLLYATDVVESTDNVQERKFFQKLIKSVEKTRDLWNNSCDNFYE